MSLKELVEGLEWFDAIGVVGVAIICFGAWLWKVSSTTCGVFVFNLIAFSVMCLGALFLFVWAFETREARKEAFR